MQANNFAIDYTILGNWRYYKDGVEVDTYGDDVELMALGDYSSADELYHIKVETDGKVYDIALSQPLRMAGTTVDTLDFTESKVIRKVGIVNLYEKYWEYNSSYKFFFTTISDKSKSDNNFVCGRYGSSVGRRSTSGMSSGDKYIAGFYDGTNLNYIRVKDVSFSDATIFKNSLSDVMLYFELGTPTEETITPMPIAFNDATVFDTKVQPSGCTWTDKNGDEHTLI